MVDAFAGHCPRKRPHNLQGEDSVAKHHDGHGHCPVPEDHSDPGRAFGPPRLCPQ